MTEPPTRPKPQNTFLFFSFKYAIVFIKILDLLSVCIFYIYLQIYHSQSFSFWFLDMGFSMASFFFKPKHFVYDFCSGGSSRHGFFPVSSTVLNNT